jgi:hypothetical protein
MSRRNPWRDVEMFTAQDVLARVKRQPFEPLRIKTSAGEQYDAYHPDAVIVTPRYVVVGIVGPVSEENPQMFEKTVMVSMLHIAAMENLPASAGSKQDNNGQ